MRVSRWASFANDASHSGTMFILFVVRFPDLISDCNFVYQSVVLFRLFLTPTQFREKVLYSLTLSSLSVFTR